MTDIEARCILGLPPAFTPRELKRAYRRAAAAHHPDKGGNVDRMVLVNEAFEVLSGYWPAASAAAPSPEQPPSWSPTPNPFRHYTAPVEHPLEPYVRHVSVVLAVCAWLAGVVDAIDKPSQLGSWVLIGLPVSYWLISMLVRVIVRCGIHAYNFGLTVYDRMDALH
jgi:hypothetical protein